MNALQISPNHAIPAWAFTRVGRKVDLVPKIIEGLPKADYHDTRALLSNSALSKFGDPNTPAHYKYWLDSPKESQDPVAPSNDNPLLTGGAFHSYVLEPAVFAREYVVMPDFGDMRSSKNRALRDGWIDFEAAGRQPITPKLMDNIKGMRESLYRNRRLRRIMEKGRPEVTIVWVDPHTGIPCKVRIDWLSEIEGAALDLKSALTAATTAHPRTWVNSAATHRYHVQDSFYTRGCAAVGIEITDFIFGVVEKKPPYLVGPYILDDASRIAGENLWWAEIQRLAECVTTGRWPGYSEDIMEVSLPRYALAAAETAQNG